MDSEDDRLAFEGEQVFRDGEGGEFLPPTPQEHIEYLEAEVQRLTADVRRLREENTQHVGVAAKVILENQRLREEIGRLDRRVSGVQALGRLNAKLTEERDSLASLLETVLGTCRAEDRGRMAPSHELLDTIATVLTCVRGKGVGDV